MESFCPPVWFSPLKPVSENVLALGIETSCDETAAAVVEASEAGCNLIAEELATRPEEHGSLGGIVPELTARQHLELLPHMASRVREKAGKKMLSAVGSTAGPGLAPALLVGLAFGKALAWAGKIPFHAINHLEGHLFSPFVSRGRWPTYPHLALIASGGHTLLVDAVSPQERKIIGSTRDDAAGEAFDKLARMVGLGYPGGPLVEREAVKGEVGRYPLPRPMKGAEGCDFSFSGLKNAARLLLEKQPELSRSDVFRSHFCAEVQAAIGECLADRCRQALEMTGRKMLTLSGGVSANRTVYRMLEESARRKGASLLSAAGGWNTDNAAMIAAVAARRALDQTPADWDVDADPRWSVALTP
ncbi:MAG: tRNA (adenosine(37)-N6)-threonylcarbamoyltransferase complex transferase subunit TsaD [Verrucomicrobia bacterium]|nr:tRNA (adenosine(37)-N6)-threonylcarbamoyltransferase complex transferase subunit TsaD [Verrucomicrobiota bacterium]